MPTPVSSTSISTYSPAATPWSASFRLSRSERLRVRIVTQPPSGMASRALTARLMIDLLELRLVGLDVPEVAAGQDLELDLLAHGAVEEGREIGQHLAQLQHLRLQRLPAREGQQLAHEAAARLALLLMFMMSR